MTEKEIEELSDELANSGVESSVFDDIIHDIFADMASATNNCGIFDQIEFLISHGYTREQILNIR